MLEEPQGLTADDTLPAHVNYTVSLNINESSFHKAISQFKLSDNLAAVLLKQSKNK